MSTASAPASKSPCLRCSANVASPHFVGGYVDTIAYRPPAMAAVTGPWALMAAEPFAMALAGRAEVEEEASGGTQSGRGCGRRSRGGRVGELPQGVVDVVAAGRALAEHVADDPASGARGLGAGKIVVFFFVVVLLFVGRCRWSKNGVVGVDAGRGPRHFRYVFLLRDRRDVPSLSHSCRLFFLLSELS